MILRIAITRRLHSPIRKEITMNSAVFNFNKTRCKNKIMQYEYKSHNVKMVTKSTKIKNKMDVHPAASKLHSQSYNSQSELRTNLNKKYVNTKSAKK